MGHYAQQLDLRGLLILPVLLLGLVLGGCASSETGRAAGVTPTPLPPTVPRQTAPVSPLSPIPPVVTPRMPPSPAPNTAASGTPGELRLSGLAQETLAKQLGVSPADIRLIQSEPVQWSDACLGAPKPGEMCAQVITPGYLLRLDTPRGPYEVHTDERGVSFRIVPAPLGVSPAPAN